MNSSDLLQSSSLLDSVQMKEMLVDKENLLYPKIK